jgi:hypothetical protein
LRSTISSRSAFAHRVERGLEAPALLAQDGLTERLSHRRRHVRGGVDRCAPGRVATLALMKVRLIANLVFGNLRQPAHHGRGIIHLCQTLEGLAEHRLQDVARFHFPAQRAPEAQANQRQKLAGAALVERVDIVRRPAARVLEKLPGVRGGHRARRYNENDLGSRFR